MIVWPGLRRSVSAIQRLFNSASFYAPLTHTLVLTRGTGSPTFTRATTATVSDNEGVLRTAIAGEARFTGARRVRNLLTFTEAFDNAAWTKDGVTATASTLTVAATTAEHRIYQLTARATLNTAMQIEAKAGTANFISIHKGTALLYATFNLATGSVVAAVGCTGRIVSVGDGWYRCFAESSTINTSYFIASVGATSANAVPGATWLGAGETVQVRKAQVEETIGQSVQTAGEYVSVGVLSAPYHGAGVDGVAYFDTDLSGNPISASTLKGYLAEGARTNLLIYSQDPSNAAWTKLAAGTGSVPVVTANYATAPDGTTTASRIQLNRGAGAGSGNYSTLRNANISGLGNPHTATHSVWMKTTGGATASVAYSSSYTGATIASVTGTWTRFEVSASVPQTIDGIDIFTRDTIGGDQSLDILVWGAQVELGSFASSYIPTTTTAVTRNADVLTYPSAGNVDGTEGWCSATCASEFSTTSAVATVLGFGNSGGVGNAGLAVWATAATTMSASDVTNRTEKTGLTSTLDTMRKRASSWGGAALQVTGDGAAPASGTFDGNTSPTVVEVGALGGSNFWYGNIRDVRIGQRALSASELQAITS